MQNQDDTTGNEQVNNPQGITKLQAQALRYGQELHYTGRHECQRIEGPRGGITLKLTRVRVSGATQTWKTRPAEFRVPVKHGLYESGEITHRNADCFHLVADCPLFGTAGDREV